MKNIHILPTDKPSRLALQLDCKPCYNLQLSKIADNWTINWQKQNIYITSDEYIGLSYYLDGNLVRKGVIDDKDYWEARKDYKKVILTTDQDLIKDGVQAIDDEFLKWFVGKANDSGKPIDVIEIQKDKCLDTSLMCDCVDEPCRNKGYKIIIPKEEPKQELSIRLQNSLTQFNLSIEEALELEDWKLKNIGFGKRSIIEINSLKPKQETLIEDYNKIYKEIDFSEFDFASFAIGVKWQQKRMYSEEDMKEAFQVGFNVGYNDEVSPSYLRFEEWFKKFKNK